MVVQGQDDEYRIAGPSKPRGNRRRFQKALFYRHHRDLYSSAAHDYEAQEPISQAKYCCRALLYQETHLHVS